MKAFLLGLGFGATLTTTLTTLTMALETECDVCHVNYFHKVERGFHSFRDCLFVSFVTTWRRNVMMMMMMPFFFPRSRMMMLCDMVDALLYVVKTLTKKNAFFVSLL